MADLHPTQHTASTTESPNAQYRLMLLVPLLVGLMYLYVKQLPYFSNMLQPMRLVAFSLILAGLILALMIWRLRQIYPSLQPIMTEIALSGFLLVFFSPLFIGLINKISRKPDQRTFTFVQERAYFSSGFGMLPAEKGKINKYALYVLDEEGDQYSFKYKKQALYPNTQPGEPVLLPLQKGLLGLSWWEAE